MAHFGGDLTRANIAPRKRARILARYGLTEQEKARLAAIKAADDAAAAKAAGEVLAARCPGCAYVPALRNVNVLGVDVGGLDFLRQ